PCNQGFKLVFGSTHTTAVMTGPWAGLCLLVPQRVTAAALARALPAEHAGSGRSCRRRVRRWWSGPVLDQATISPALIRLALTLLAAEQPVVVALDTTRLGAWEGWLAGIVMAGGAPSPPRAGPPPPPPPTRPPRLAQGALPAHDAGAPPAPSAGLPSRRALDAGRGPWLSERGALCPMASGWHGLQHAVAVE